MTTLMWSGSALGLGIDVDRTPVPPSCILNDGTGVESYDWSIEFDSLPDHYVEILLDPNGSLVYCVYHDLIGWNFPPAPPYNICSYVDESADWPQASPVVGANSWVAPANAMLGRYELRIQYFSDAFLQWEAEGAVTFYVCQATGNITVAKWHDLNCDGIHDIGEPGVENWIISVTDPFGTTFNRLTDANGMVSMEDVPIGHYSVWEKMKPNWTPSAPVSYEATLLTNQTLEFEFGNYQTGSIGDWVWYDDDKDGQQDNFEGGIANVTVRLFLDADGNGDFETLVDETTTAPDGWYLFEDLPTGKYMVEVDEGTLPPGDYVLTTPPNPREYELSCEEDYLDADFGYYKCIPEICDGKDNDCDGDIDEDFPLLGDACDDDDSDLCALGHYECYPPSICRNPGGCNIPTYLCVDDDPSDIVEICDGIDNDCDGDVDEGFPVGQACDSDDSDLCENGTYTCMADGSDVECVNESDLNIQELCDGNDNDCDGQIDEDFPQLGDACDTDDSDLCAYGHLVCFPPAYCRDPAGCNQPTYLCVEDLPSGVEEICDGLDNDCDGSVDEGQGTTTCGVGACQVTVDNCVAGQWQNCVPGNPVDEVCDLVDNNCNGSVDEGLGTTTCGVGACLATVDNCIDGEVQTCVPGTPVDEVCDLVDNDCDGPVDEGLGTTTCGVGACEETVANCVDGEVQTCVPGAPVDEVCDLVDNNCNGSVDEGLGTTTCGIGECQNTVDNCVAGEVQSCVPGAVGQEVCDLKDNDCDGSVDEDLGSTTCGTGACEETVQNCVAGETQTCVPGTPVDEICDLVDNDCDGSVDEGLGTTTCGVGACEETVQNCVAGETQTCVPGTPVDEVCDLADNDCDGSVDEELGTTTCGVGACEATVDNCVAGQTQTCVPGTPVDEVCDLADNDCDGSVDEGLGTTSCGVGACVETVDNCVNGQTQTCVPGTPVAETCDLADNDCDGSVDEELGTTTCGVGECEATVENCVDGEWQNCQPGSAGQEVCDLADNDCDGNVDEGLGTTTCGIGECQATVENCIDGQWQNCQPGSAGQEVCDLVDNDCDGAIDEGLGTTTCGVGACTQTVENCIDGETQTCVPGAPGNEVCDLVDNDCDGDVDEGLGTTTCGVGECEATVDNCINGQVQTCVPGTPVDEICDLADNDCDGSVDEELGTTTCGVGACQETVDNCVNGQVQTCVPGAPGQEVCDGIDNDCDGDVDEGLGTTTCGVGECEATVDNCVNGVPQQCVPGGSSTEVCDGADNDCDGFVDEDLGSTTCGVGECEATVDNCVNGQVQTCAPGTPVDEICDLADNDCDGSVDEELGTTTCGSGACEETVDNCVAGQVQTCVPGTPVDEICDLVDNDCDGDVDENLGTTTCGVGACEATVDNCVGGQVQTCVPGQGSAEVCDLVDNDCDGDVDEGLGTTTCGVGACEATVDNCVNGQVQTCEPGQGSGEVCDLVDNDCDGETDEGLGTTTCGEGACQTTVDNCVGGQEQTCVPGQGSAELCDLVDNDCDGDIDEGLGTTTCGVGACEATVDNCVNGETQDCQPGAPVPETCDLVDNDCDGSVDEELGTTTCGVGACEATVDNCVGGQEQTCVPGQGSDEVCDLVDNDCDGSVDEQLGTTTCGVGACEATVDNCVGGQEQTCVPGQGADEVCDLADNDCDGEIDEGLGSTTCGVGTCEATTENCIDGQVQTCTPGNPAPEVCDLADNDCDGDVDEGLGTTTCGVGECEATTENCVDGEVQSCTPAQPGSEVCDLADNDCDGSIDEDLGTTTCGQGVCEHTVENCINGETQTCDPFEGAQTEECDGIDNDCDGDVDEDCGCIGDLVFWDKAGNAAFDGDDEGIAGVTVQLWKGGVLLDSTTTDGSGLYGFSNLLAGNYSVKVLPASLPAPGAGNGWVKTFGANPQSVAVTGGPCYLGADWGFFKAMPCADVEKTGPATAAPGETITYHFKICNCGNTVLAGGLQVVDPMLGGTLWHKTTQPGECAEFDKSYTIPASAQLPLCNTAKAIGCAPYGLPNAIDEDTWCIECLATDEVCDGVDNDCDGEVDENMGTTTCGLGICVATVENCVDGMPQTCVPGDPDAEVCDLIDNDCDGEIDEDLGTTTCGVGECEVTIDNCGPITPDLVSFAAGLPDQVDMKVAHPGTGFGAPSYYDVTILGSSVLAGVFDNFCIDTDNTINPGAIYTVNVYSSYEVIPDGVVEFPENFDLVNYILNQGYAGTASQDGSLFTYSDVQRAIWTLIDDTMSTAGLGPWSQDRVDQILDDALANGEGFEPDCDQYIGVVLAPVGGYQITMAQVSLALVPEACDPIQECVPGTPSDEICDGLDNDCDGEIDEDLGTTTCGVGECEVTVDNCVLAEADLVEFAAGLPDQVDMKVAHPGTGFGQPSYYDVTILGTSVLAGVFDNFCIDTDNTINPGAIYTVNVYSSYELIPDGVVEFPENFDLVNYILNQGYAGTASQDGSLFTYSDVQRAIWTLIDDAMSTAGLGPWSQDRVDQILDDALANGEGFEPDCDQYIGVILAPVGGYQVTMAQVTMALVPGLCDPTPECVPGTPSDEICDGLDNDCDGEIDEDLGASTCGIGECEASTENCIDGEVQTCTPGDAEPELCDLADNDCDGDVDEDLGSTTCGLGICEHTVENCVNGVTQTCDPLEGAMAEACDGLDNDCDGAVDEVCGCVGDLVFWDKAGNGVFDGDDEGIAGVTVQLWKGGVLVNSTTTDGSGLYGFSDLLVGNYSLKVLPATLPVAGAGNAWVKTYGANPLTVAVTGGPCYLGADWGFFKAMPCADVEKTGPDTASPGETITYHFKICNCGNTVLSGGLQVVDPMLGGKLWHKTTQPGECAEFDKSYTIPVGATGPWCNTAKAIGCAPYGLPNAVDEDTWCIECLATDEVCDGVDNDCDGHVDEDLGVSTCGVGACAASTENCINGVPQTCVPGDPTAEICDGIDNDCDGDVDEGLGTISCGLGACANSVEACIGGVPQTCVPGDPTAEICDGLDNDCDGDIDEDFPLGESCSIGGCGGEGIEVWAVSDDNDPLIISTGDAVLTGSTLACNFEHDYDGMEEYKQFFVDTVTVLNGGFAPTVLYTYGTYDGADWNGMEDTLDEMVADGSLGGYDMWDVSAGAPLDLLPGDLDGVDVVVLDAAPDTAANHFVLTEMSKQVLRDYQDAGGKIIGSAYIFVYWYNYTASQYELQNTDIADLFGDVLPDITKAAWATATTLEPSPHGAGETLVTLIGAEPWHKKPADPFFHEFWVLSAPTVVSACYSEGVYECAPDGTAVCDAEIIQPGDELCGDNIDNDCDCEVDEGFEDLGDACSAGVGECYAEGEMVCSADLLSTVCDAVAGDAVDEICDDDLDNDCDGLTDEGCVCPHTIGYWKNHPGAWPVEQIEIGGVIYSKAEAIVILKAANSKDATHMLAAQLIASKLNILADGPADIQPVIDAADAFLVAHPYGSDPQGADRAYALNLKDQLDAYNNGSDYDFCECEADCDGKECGTDGCGGSCGTCEDGFVCNDANLCECDPVDEICDGKDNDCDGEIDEVCGCVGDLVFWDKDGNGAFDGADEGISGVTVKLKKDGVLLGTMTTGADGKYQFDNLMPGTYVVKMVESTLPVAGAGNKWVKTYGANPATVVVGSQCNLTADFGWFKAMPCADVEKTGPATASPGETITYHFKICNCGNTVLSGGLQVVDPMLGGKLWHKTTQPGECAEFDKTYTIPLSATAPLCNTAQAIGCAPYGLPNATDEDTWCITCLASDEVCDGLDNDCDGLVDEGFGTQTCGVGSCQVTVEECVGGVPQTCVPGTAQPEICDLKDNDCDGAVDEDLGTTTCGAGACKKTVNNCVAGQLQVCVPGTPGSEVCDGIDNDCDGVVDEGFGTETCGVGACEASTAVCVDGQTQTCVPGTPVPEICDDMIDNDCDGEIDEGCQEDNDCELPPDCVGLAEAFARDWIAIDTPSSGTATVTMHNLGTAPVCFDENLLLFSDPTQSMSTAIKTATGAAIVIPAGGARHLRYAPWTFANGVYQPYLNQAPWWCIEAGQLATANTFFGFYGEATPPPIAHFINDNTNVDGDWKEDHVDWAGSYGTQALYNIWKYQQNHVVLTAGKVAGAAGPGEVAVVLASHNIGALSGDGVLVDTIPAGFWVDNFSLEPDIWIEEPDGSITMGWNISLAGYEDVWGMGGTTTFDMIEISYDLHPAWSANGKRLVLPRAQMTYTDGCKDRVSESAFVVAINVDIDGDGFAACSDCNDGDQDVYPGADELCDGVDNDCDGEIDEGCPVCGNGIIEACEVCDDGDGNADEPNMCQTDCTLSIMWPTSGQMTVAFEDLPAQGDNDWDYNDWVMEVETEYIFDCNGAKEMRMYTDPWARGAAYHHSTGLAIAMGTYTSTGSYTVLHYDEQWGFVSAEPPVDFDPNVDLAITMFEDTWETLPPNHIGSDYGTYGFDANTEPGYGIVLGEKIGIEFTFDQPLPLAPETLLNVVPGTHGADMPFDLYLLVNNTGEYIANGDNRFLCVPDYWDWPAEREAIWTVYGGITPAAGGPIFDEGWWLDAPLGETWYP